MRRIERILDIILLFVLIGLLLGLSIHAKAEPSDPFNEPVKVRCTCYTDGGLTASGKEVRPGIMASKPEWIGCVACVNKVNEDGSIGEFIGLYEILDTGYGRETGVGESRILKGRTLGTIETGETVDIYQPTMHQVDEWISNYGDEVYIKLVRGVG